MKNNLKTLLEYLLMKEEPEERHPFEISVDDLVAHRHSLIDAYDNCVYRDRCSRSSGPIVVVPVENGKYQLIDGYHRLIEHLLDGAERLLVVIGGEGSREYAVAHGAERWQGDAKKPYGNLGAVIGPNALSDGLAHTEKRKRWKGLSSLAAEARKAGSYGEFEQDYMRQYKRGLYWHVTMDPDFKINPNKGPQDKSAGGFGQIMTGGLMFTSDLERWSGHYGKERGYAALLDMTKVPRESYRQVSRGFGNEFFLHNAANSEASVEKVVQISTAKRIDKQYNKLLPKSYEELKEFYEWAIKQ